MTRTELAKTAGRLQMLDRAIGIFGIALAIIFGCLPLLGLRIPVWVVWLGVLSGLILTGFAFGLFFGGYRISRQGKETFFPSSVKLQFHGGTRIPEECVSENIASWFAYFSPSFQMHASNEDKTRQEPMFKLPLNWMLFLSF